MCIFNIFLSSYAQEAQFTSNAENMLLSNPAYAGTNAQMNTYGIHKNQYFGIFQTTALGFDTRVKMFKKDHGVGMTIFQDKNDMIEDLIINFIYSYRHSVWNGTIGYGVQFGFNNMTWLGSLNDSSLTSKYGQEYSSEIQRYATEVKSFKFDIGLGGYYQDDKLYLGASLSHLNRPEMSITNTEDAYLYLPRTLSLSAGYTISPIKRPDFEIKPSVFFKMIGNNFQTDFVTDIWYLKRFKGGIGFRLQESIFFLAGWQMKNGMYLGTAYDVVTNHIALGQPGYGSLEFLFRYSFNIEFAKRDFKYKSIRIL